jgi:hypothetical protein
MLKQNQTNQPELCSSGAAREGRALLQGLLLCGKCGRRLSPRYTGNGGIYPIYECTRRHKDAQYSPDCIWLPADPIDQVVSKRMLEILQPAQIEIALRAVQELERRSQAIDQQWRMRLERLEYQVQLAQRRYEEVDPSNRLVAGTLEQRWNEALQAKASAQEELNVQRKQQGLELTEELKGQLLTLAKDLPQLWKSPSTAAQDRKRILRLLIKDITVQKERVTRKAVLHIRWQGGAVEDLGVDLPQPIADRIRYPVAMVDRVRALAMSLTDEQIVATLNQEGLLSAKGKLFNPNMIKFIRNKHHIPAPSFKLPEELTVNEVGRRLNVRNTAVYYWIEHKILPSRKIGPGLPLY